MPFFTAHDHQENYSKCMRVLFFSYCVVWTKQVQLYCILFNFFSQFFDSVGKLISFQLYLSMHGSVFTILSGCFQILSWFSAIILWVCCNFFIIYPVIRFYVWPTTIETYSTCSVIHLQSRTQNLCPLLIFLNLFNTFVKTN